jgi:cyclic pyranopterin phosphate synthase
LTDSGSSAARLFRIAGTAGVCGFISPVTQPFCESCSRIRLRGDGKLLPCLTSADGYDLMPYVRPALRVDELVEYLRRLLPGCKPRPAGQRPIRGMFKIGG